MHLLDAKNKKTGCLFWSVCLATFSKHHFKKSDFVLGGHEKKQQIINTFATLSQQFNKSRYISGIFTLFGQKPTFCCLHPGHMFEVVLGMQSNILNDLPLVQAVMKSQGFFFTALATRPWVSIPTFSLPEAETTLS